MSSEIKNEFKKLCGVSGEENTDDIQPIKFKLRQNKDIKGTSKMQEILFNWCGNVIRKFYKKETDEIFYILKKIFDYIIVMLLDKKINRKYLQLIGCLCIFMSCKIYRDEDNEDNDKEENMIKEIVEYTDNSYTYEALYEIIEHFLKYNKDFINGCIKEVHNRKKHQKQLEDENTGESKFDSVYTCFPNEEKCSLVDILGEDKFATEIFKNGEGCVHYKKGDQMGDESLYGKVYYTCCDEDDCNHITKIVNFSGRYKTTRSEFMKELRFGQQASKLGVGPTISNAYLTEDKGIIVMERLELSLLEYIARFIERVKPDDPDDIVYNFAKIVANNISKLLVIMHSNGLFHGDLHAGNIMIEKKGREYSFKLIDFGRTEKIPQNMMLCLKNDYYDSTDIYSRFNYEYRLAYDLYSTDIIEYMEKNGVLTDKQKNACKLFSTTFRAELDKNRIAEQQFLIPLQVGYIVDYDC